MPSNWCVLTSSNGVGFEAYIAQPAKGSGPGLVLCLGADQNNRSVPASSGTSKDVSALAALADQWAEEGYVVLAIAPAKSHADVSEIKGAFAQTYLDQMRSAAQVLKTHATCRGHLGVLVNCAVSAGCLSAIAEGLFACAIIYLDQEPDRYLDVLRQIEVPTLLHVASGPSGATPSRVEAARTALARLKPDPVDADAVEIVTYPNAAFGFAKRGHSAFDLHATGLAYSRSLALLRRVLGPRYNLQALWDAHRHCEFGSRDADATMATMVAEPYVNHVPTMTGGFGATDLRRFYGDHFIPNNPRDMRNIPISQTVGVDRVVNEGILCFTHDCEIEWMLPGVAPTGRYVEVGLVGIITFRGDKLANEHIYWDQASVLVQIGLLDPRGLPVAGVDAARKVKDPARESNALMPRWLEPPEPPEQPR